jgi:pimeloyl-ACP methyl ester carboxylesterase
MNQFTKLIENYQFLFKSFNFKNLDGIKAKWAYLKNTTNLITPIVINGVNSDLYRTKLGTFKNPLINYTIDQYQQVHLRLISNIPYSEKIYTKSRDVWIIIHGFSDRFDGDFQSIATSIVGYKPEDIVIGVDWADIADGLSPAVCLDVCKSSTWIRPISVALFNRLTDWGLEDAGKIHIISHSLGSILATEISLRFYEQNGTKIATLIALDPPSEFTTITYFEKDPVYLTQLRPKVLRTSSFSNVSQFSISIVGHNSIAGNPEFAKTAHFSYLMKFNKLLEFRHGHTWIVEAFADMIKNEYIFDKVENLQNYLVKNKMLETNTNPSLIHDAIINYGLKINQNS